jgi:hypothetical protein
MKKILLIFSLSLFSILAYSQDEGPPEEQIPVDGGVSLLFAAGAAWGIKKLKDKK